MYWYPSYKKLLTLLNFFLISIKTGKDSITKFRKNKEKVTHESRYSEESISRKFQWCNPREKEEEEGNSVQVQESPAIV